MSKRAMFRRDVPENPYTPIAAEPIFEKGDVVRIKNHKDRRFVVLRAVDDMGYRGRLYDVTFNGMISLAYEHDMTLAGESS